MEEAAVRRVVRIKKKKKKKTTSREKRTNLWEDRFDEAIFSMLHLSYNIFTIELVCTRSRIRRF